MVGCHFYPAVVQCGNRMPHFFLGRWMERGMWSQLWLIIKLLESTPLKINMEHNHGGLEDHCPFMPLLLVNKYFVYKFHLNLPGCSQDVSSSQEGRHQTCLTSPPKTWWSQLHRMPECPELLEYAKPRKDFQFSNAFLKLLWYKVSRRVCVWRFFEDGHDTYECVGDLVLDISWYQ